MSNLTGSLFCGRFSSSWVASKIALSSANVILNISSICSEAASSPTAVLRRCIQQSIVYLVLTGVMKCNTKIRTP